MRSLVAVLSAVTLISSVDLCDGQTSSVSLTVEGGGSLVGPHCPGSVTLVCNGVDLTFIEWSINSGTTIVTFLPDGTPSNQTIMNFNVELRSVLVSPTDVRVANFSTILTADVSLLESQNVMEIACAGTANTLDSLPVDVTIIPPRIPQTPNITAVTATYSSGMLTSIEVMWRKLNTPCPVYEDSTVYEVNLTSISSVQTKQAPCTREGTVCAIQFDFFEIADYEVSISAINSVGTSETGVYEQHIAQCSRDYFTPEVIANSTDCRIVGRCVPMTSLNTSCTVKYTTNSAYINLLDVIVTDGESFELSEGIQPSTTYYFKFSVTVNNSLRVTIREPTSTGPDCIAQDSQNILGVIIGVIAAVIVILVVCFVTIVIIIKLKMRHKKLVINRDSKKKKKEQESTLTSEELNPIAPTIGTGTMGGKSEMETDLHEKMPEDLKTATSEKGATSSGQKMIEWPDPNSHREIPRQTL